MNQRVTCELYTCYGNHKSRRIAVLPNADDELVEIIKSKYPQPKYWVRLITELPYFLFGYTALSPGKKVGLFRFSKLLLCR